MVRLAPPAAVKDAWEPRFKPLPVAVALRAKLPLVEPFRVRVPVKVGEACGA